MNHKISLNSFLIWLGSACMAAFILVHQLHCPAEVALNLSMSERVFGGAVPYVDFIDNADPFCYYFNLPVIWLSRVLFIHPVFLANLLHLALFAAALFCVEHCLGHTRGAKLLAPRLPWLTVFSFAGLALFMAEFGQITQCLVFFSLPYWTTRYLAALGQKTRPPAAIFAGLLMAVAVLLDPPFICFLAAGELVIALARPRKYFDLSLIVLALSIIGSILLILNLMTAGALAAYLGPIRRLNELSFEFFNDALFYVEKSPDRRDLLYFYALSLAVSLPVACRCLLTRILAALSAVGLAYYVITVNLFTWQSLAMVGYSALALALALGYYGVKISLPCKAAVGGISTKVALSAVTVVLLGLIAMLSRIPGPDWFSLASMGYHGKGLKSDLTIFSSSIEEYCPKGKHIVFFGTQVRPGYPAAYQLRRSGGYLGWGFPVLPLKTMKERKTPEQVADLLEFEKNFYSRLKSDWSGPDRPAAIVVEDNEAHDALWGHGLNEVIERDYEPGPYLSLMNGDELAGHPRFEYVGYLKSYTLYKLRPGK